MKSENLNFLEPSGPLQACNGFVLPLLYIVWPTAHYVFTLPSNLHNITQNISELWRLLFYLSSHEPQNSSLIKHVNI